MKNLLLLLLFSCATINKKDQSIKEFRYQLQGYDSESLKRIENSANTLWVIDESKSTDILFASYDIEKFKHGTNTLISYLSLGEAEKYRSYFKNLPQDLIVKNNPDWNDNYHIRYWRDSWKKIIFNRLDVVIDSGFDGVMYDVVDAFALYTDKALYAKEMATLIIKTSEYAKSKAPNFQIYLQNASVLFDYLSAADKLAVTTLISGGTIESVLFEHAEGKPLPIVHATTQTYITTLLEAKKLVFSIEYLDDETKISNYLTLMNKLRILGLVTDKTLQGDFFISNKLNHD